METNKIQRAAQQRDISYADAPKQSLSALVNTFLDSNAMRKRFDELLGARTPQFMSSLCSLINGNADLARAFSESPMSVIQSALKAATFDLPIEPSLGFAYIVPFNNKKKLANGEERKVMEATFVLGYKGMEQLCLRTGAYSRVPDAVDVREGELISYDRLTGDCEFRWIEDEEERDSKPIIGYAGFFRLKNGAEKTIYMSKKQIEQHERKNRKGQYMGKGWRDSWDDMAKKTVLRRLISRYGLMSIDYQQGGADVVRIAADAMREDYDYPAVDITGEDSITIDPVTGEIE